MPRRIDRLLSSALADTQVSASEVTELIKHLKRDDVLAPDERVELTTFLARHRDRFEPEAVKLVTSFLDGGVTLTTGRVADPKLSWTTVDSTELRSHRSPRVYLNGIDADDVVQNELGDCFLMASLSALATARPEVIENAITDRGDGTFAIRFFEAQRNGPPREVTIEVDADLPVNDKGELIYGQGRDPKELWPALVEKAWAAWKGGYSELAIGGLSSDALFALTGENAEFYNPITEISPQALWDVMVAAKERRSPMVIGSGADPSEGYVPMHMYSVVAIREENGERFVTLRNPYGYREPGKDGTDDGVFEITLRQLRRNFEDLYLLQDPASP